MPVPKSARPSYHLFIEGMMADFGVPEKGDDGRYRFVSCGWRSGLDLRLTETIESLGHQAA